MKSVKFLITSAILSIWFSFTHFGYKLFVSDFWASFRDIMRPIYALGAIIFFILGWVWKDKPAKKENLPEVTNDKQ